MEETDMNEIEKNNQIVASVVRQLREEYGSKEFDERGGLIHDKRI